MFLIDGRFFLFIMETAHSGVLPTGDADAGGAGRYVVALACFALIRRWRATFPLEGEGFCGDSVVSCNTS